MGCEILDFRCILVSELIGSTVLAGIAMLVLYFVIAGKLRFGFETTIYFLAPMLLIVGLAITGFSVIYAFTTVVVAIMVAWVFNRIVGNK